MPECFFPRRLPVRLLPMLALACAAGVAAAQNPPIRLDDPTLRKPPTTPNMLEREGVPMTAPEARSRRELFSLQGMVFSFVDATDAGQFVRRLEGGQREAQVRVEQAAKNFRRQFLLRADCRDATSYFGPAAGPVLLKPVEAGSVGALLYEELCAG